VSGFVRAHPWWVGTVLLVLFSFGLVRWAGTRPGYDPYGWLIWGYQTLHLSLDLGGAPSWKPLTWLFDVPFSLFGSYALWLWMTTSVAISLAGGIFGGRIAYRLVDGPEVSRWIPWVAGAFAGAGVLGTQDYFHYLLSNQSDPMIVTFVLAAIDCAMRGRHRWAIVLGVLASLGRPEAWPFLGLYAIWVWRTVPSLRWFLGIALAAIPIAWFGVPTITNNRPFVSGQLALASPRELHQNKVFGTIGRFTALQYFPIELAAMVGVAIAAVRRNVIALLLAAGAVGWVLVEVAFVLHGWPGVPRDQFEPGAIVAVLAGAAVGWVLQEAPRVGHRVPAWAGIALAVVLCGVLVPGAISRLRTEHRDLRHERDRAVVINRLKATLNAIGGPKAVLRCGPPVTTVEYVSILAWYTNLNDGKVGHRPKFEMLHKHPTIIFVPLHSGWSVLPWHIPPSRAGCNSLKRSFIFTRHHPNGVLAHYIAAPIQ
jgi:hypothetical protein